jgi:CO/xanthine dehydrogenase Mo-binding subunit
MKQSAAKKAAPIYTFGEVTRLAGRRIEAVYELPMLAHAPMEPGNTVAHFQGDKCEIWSPTQVPQAVRDDSAKALGLDPDKIIVNVTLIGGGFGRRLESDYGVEAAVVSKAIHGPVKVLWTREDDMRSSTYRPPSYHVMSAVLDGQGWPVSFQHKFVSPSMNFQKGGVDPSGLDSELKDECTFLYAVPHVNLEYVYVESPVPYGWMRSVYGQHAAFAQECFLDEIAISSGKDPLALRLHLLAEDRENPPYRNDRLKGVLQLAADKAGWGKPLPAGRFRGIAAHCCFNSYAAEVVEISMDGDKPKVHRVVAVIDCGQVVNPSILSQQLEGGVTFALSNAMKAKITVEKGRIVQSNFDDYEMLRMSEAPVVEAHFVESSEAPSGAGEPTVPPLAPALCNAIYAATKKRIRSLPVVNS